MAKITNMLEHPSHSSQPQPFVNKLMEAGKYKGKIVDIGFSEDKNRTRKIIFVTLARDDKTELSPRIIRARFDVWSPDIMIYQYAITGLFHFTKAIHLEEDFDTEDVDLIEKLLKKCLFKDVFFTVERLSSKNGFSFNVVKNFESCEDNKTPPAIQSKEISQEELISNAVAANPLKTEEIKPATGGYVTPKSIPPVIAASPENWLEDDVPF